MPKATSPTETRTQPSSRLATTIAFLAPVALIAGLGLADGGYDLEARHIAGILAWLVVIAILGTGAAAGVTPARPALLAFGLVLALAALSLASSFWSGSVERSFAEAGRVLAYLGFLVAAFLIAQTDTLRQRFAEGLVVAIVIVAFLALISRLTPDLIFFADHAGGTRLRFPLGYWNANGVLIGIGVALLLWMRRYGSNSFLRDLSAAAIPLCLLTLYFTYSRGGTLAAVIAVGVLLALSEDRLRHLATLILGLIATAPAVIAVMGRREIADGPAEGAAAGQGLTVLLMLAAGMALMPVAIALFARLSARYPGLPERAERSSRNPRVLRGVGAVVAVLAIAAAVAIGDRVWSQFADEDLQFSERPEEHFTQFSGAGRHEFWRVALAGFGENPIAGTGAGSYTFTWREKRDFDQPVQDAHSLYLEAFSELGLIGGVLTLAMIVALIAISLAAWSRDLRAARERSAALVAAMIAFAVAAGVDWLWEIAAVGAVFFLAAGVLIGARCFQLQSTPGARPAPRESSRYAYALGGIAVGWISIAILIGPLFMQIELNRSQAAAADGNVPEAAEHALTARSLQPWAASPYVQLGGLAELEGNPEVAYEHYHEAVQRESHNWQLWYLAAGAAAAAGDESTAQRYLERAEELNPMAPEFDTESGNELP